MNRPDPDRIKRVLIVDDEENIRHLLLVLLKRAGYEPTAVGSGADALKQLGRKRYGIVISDIRMPGMDGRELLAKIRADGHDVYTIMMSAYGGVDTALACMKEGAYDYFNKPFKADEVVLTLAKVAERERLARENEELRDALGGTFRAGNIVGRSERMREILQTVEKIAPFKTTVLITGESGTGKELMAGAIHSSSDRPDGSLVPINCGAIPEHLIESELFGHAKGAFTGAIKAKIGLFEEAHGGTLFLDEIGELPSSVQVKLLRVLESHEVRPVGETQSKKVDVRVLAATSRDLEQMVADGSFREDLFYRLNVLHIRLPSLRERKEDIPTLVEHFLVRFNKKLRRAVEGVEAEAMELLLAHSWPGNIRELENAMERAMILSEGPRLRAASLPPRVREARGLAGRPTDDDDLSIKRRLPALEAALIARALRKTGGNRTQACKLLEISHRALLYKMKDYGIDVPARGAQ